VPLSSWSCAKRHLPAVVVCTHSACVYTHTRRHTHTHVCTHLLTANPNSTRGASGSQTPWFPGNLISSGDLAYTGVFLQINTHHTKTALVRKSQKQKYNMHVIGFMFFCELLSHGTFLVCSRRTSDLPCLLRVPVQQITLYLVKRMFSNSFKIYVLEPA